MRTILRLVPLVALFLTAFLSSAGQGAPPPGSGPRIAPELWRATAGGSSSFFVILREQADLSAARTLTEKEAKGRLVYRQLVTTATRSQARLRAWLEEREIPYRPFYIVNALLVEGDRELVVALARHPDVARLVANPRLRAALPQPAPSAPRGMQAEQEMAIEPGIVYVNADRVWELGYLGQGIVIGGQDTGYQWDHPALIQQYRGWDGTTVNHDYNWHDSIHSNSDSNRCGFDSPVPCDDYGHGTHTMGTAVGADGSNRIGMAPDARWIGCRNMDNGWGSPASYLECFQFFLAPYPVGGTFEEDGRPEMAPHVTINSWTCPPAEGCAPETLQAAVEAQVAAGIMTVVSAGNSGGAGCSSINTPPAHYEAAYTVGALQNGTDMLASFSSRGPVSIDGSGRVKPDISAPGTYIRSSIPENGYGYMSGTSMAAPHVAGAVALLWSARPDLTGELAASRTLLNRNSVPIESVECSSDGFPNNLYGYGRLDIFAAVQEVLNIPHLQIFLPLAAR